MRNKTKNIRMKLEVTISACGNSFLYEIFIDITQQKEKSTVREKNTLNHVNLHSALKSQKKSL